MSGVTESYSLWLYPKGELYDRVQKEIIYLKEQHNGVFFKPHVTLLGGIDSNDKEHVLAVAKELSQQLHSYTVKLRDVSCGKIFHQCVYFLCETSEETMAAGRAARAAYGLDPNSTYMPHLSLLYSDIDQETRSRLAEEETARLCMGSEGSEPLPAMCFTAEGFSVWYTPVEDKTLESWKEVAYFAFPDAKP